jgi:hypothetical protein
MNIRKRIIGIVMVLTLLPLGGLAANAHSSSYCEHGQTTGFEQVWFHQHISANPHEHGYEHYIYWGDIYDHYAAKYCSN